MAGAGIPEEDMARVVLNPQTNAGISPMTLRKHFRDELDRGHTKANLNVAQGLYKNATTATPTYPGGIPLAQIFWLKTQARWRTVDKAEPPGAPSSPEQMDARETARRMAFLLSAGAAQLERETQEKAAAVPKPKAKADS